MNPRELDKRTAAQLLEVQQSVVDAEKVLADARLRRGVLIGQILDAGHTLTSVANLLRVTPTAIRHMSRRGQRPTSRRYTPRS